MKKKFIFLISFVMLVLVIGCGNEETTEEQGSDEVKMQNLSFIPETLKISPGTEVTWTNLDSVAHTVRSADTSNNQLLFESGSIALNGTFSYKFESTGTYNYYCEIHAQHMNGVIVVK